MANVLNIGQAEFNEDGLTMSELIGADPVAAASRRQRRIRALWFPRWFPMDL
jgi:hypothetical protein